jgi:dTDP-4-dehydrorhamnose reductase
MRRILITGKNGYIAKSLATNLGKYFDFTYPNYLVVLGWN